jgi:hypothetical protein
MLSKQRVFEQEHVCLPARIISDVYALATLPRRWWKSRRKWSWSVTVTCNAAHVVRCADDKISAVPTSALYRGVFVNTKVILS